MDEPLNRRAAILQGWWRALGTWTPDEWILPLAVVHDGDVVGSQTLEGPGFRSTRTVDTASWLVPDARGRGWGTQARAAVLELAFGVLGAEAAVTSAWCDNHASLGVSRSLGTPTTACSCTRAATAGTRWSACGCPGRSGRHGPARS